jgi:AraC family transcriptional regulator
MPADRNGTVDQPVVRKPGCDDEMLRSIDEIASRLPPGQISVMASTRALGWESIHGAITTGRLEDFFDYSAPFPVVAFSLKGATTVEWTHGSRFTRFSAQPGEFLITPAGERNSLRYTQPIEAFTCCLHPELLQTLAAQEWGVHNQPIEIVAGFNRDPEFWRLGERLAARLRSPIAGSRLFAESLVTQIAIKLLWSYSSLPRPSQGQPEKLADPRLGRVIDYLHGSMGEEISLEGLAQVAGLSPNYFLHAFRQATGQTPHRYLTELRIAKACELLEDPHRSIVEVSLAVGFSSQSHLTTVFRRFMKTTPAAYRQQILGLRSGAP